MILEGAEAEDILARVKPGAPLTKAEVTAAAPPLLGYRGLVVEQIEDGTNDLPKMFRVSAGKVFGQKLAHHIADPNVEHVILAPSGPLRRVPRAEQLAGILAQQVQRIKKGKLHKASAPPKPIANVRHFMNRRGGTTAGNGSSVTIATIMPAITALILSPSQGRPEA